MKLYMKDIRYTDTMKNRERYFGDLHGRTIMKWVNRYWFQVPTALVGDKFTDVPRNRWTIMEMVEDMRAELPSVSYAVLARIAFALDCLITDIAQGKARLN